MNPLATYHRMAGAALAAVVALACSTSPTRAGEDEGDVIVGRSSVGQLKIGGFIPDQGVSLLDPSSGLFNGWTSNEPGFDHLIADEPNDDFFTLQSGCQIRLELVGADPAFRAVTNTFDIIDDPGESALLGGATLHEHLTWHVNSDDPAFDPLKVLWRATFQLIDTGTTAYTHSNTFTFHFATVDCTRGDCNGDAAIDGRDIPDFIATVLDPSGRTDEDRCRADTDRDGYATADDVASFVELLMAGG